MTDEFKNPEPVGGGVTDDAEAHQAQADGGGEPGTEPGALAEPEVAAPTPYKPAQKGGTGLVSICGNVGQQRSQCKIKVVDDTTGHDVVLLIDQARVKSRTEALQAVDLLKSRLENMDYPIK